MADATALNILPPALRENYHYAILFLSPKSKKWDNLKTLLQKVTTYEHEDNFIALFLPSLDDFKILYTVLQTTAGWRSATYFHKDDVITRMQMLRPVECIVNLKSLAGQREACLSEDIIYGHWSGDFTRDNKKFIIPCKQARGFGYNKVGNSYKKLFMIHAQEIGVSMCPFFDEECFRGPYNQQDNMRDMTVSISLDDMLGDTQREDMRQNQEQKPSLISRFFGLFKGK